MLPSYRIQSIDSHSKLIDWFLYEGNTGNSWVNLCIKICSSPVTFNTWAEAHSESSQTSKMERFEKIYNGLSY